MVGRVEVYANGVAALGQPQICGLCCELLPRWRVAAFCFDTLDYYCAPCAEHLLTAQAFLARSYVQGSGIRMPDDKEVIELFYK